MSPSSLPSILFMLCALDLWFPGGAEADVSAVSPSCRGGGSAGLSRLTDAASHSVPQVLSKVHLGLREHPVDDCFRDPALPKQRDRADP